MLGINKWRLTVDVLLRSVGSCLFVVSCRFLPDLFAVRGEVGMFKATNIPQLQMDCIFLRLVRVCLDALVRHGPSAQLRHFSSSICGLFPTACTVLIGELQPCACSATVHQRDTRFHCTNSSEKEHAVAGLLKSMLLLQTNVIVPDCSYDVCQFLLHQADFLL